MEENSENRMLNRETTVPVDGDLEKLDGNLTGGCSPQPINTLVGVLENCQARANLLGLADDHPRETEIPDDLIIERANFLETLMDIIEKIPKNLGKLLYGALEYLGSVALTVTIPVWNAMSSIVALVCKGIDDSLTQISRFIERIAKFAGRIGKKVLKGFKTFFFGLIESILLSDVLDKICTYLEKGWDYFMGGKFVNDVMQLFSIGLLGYFEGIFKVAQMAARGMVWLGQKTGLITDNPVPLLEDPDYMALPHIGPDIYDPAEIRGLDFWAEQDKETLEEIGLHRVAHDCYVETMGRGTRAVLNDHRRVYTQTIADIQNRMKDKKAIIALKETLGFNIRAFERLFEVLRARELKWMKDHGKLKIKESVRPIGKSWMSYVRFVGDVARNSIFAIAGYDPFYALQTGL